MIFKKLGGVPDRVFNVDHPGRVHRIRYVHFEFQIVIAGVLLVLQGCAIASGDAVDLQKQGVVGPVRPRIFHRNVAVNSVIFPIKNKGDLFGDARRAMRHGPADMTVPGVEVEVAQATASELRQIVRRHRPEARPHLGAVIVGAFGIKLLCHGLHEGEIGRLVAGVVAGEFGRGGDADAVAEA